MLSFSVFLSCRSSGGSACSLSVCCGAYVLLSVDVDVCSMLVCSGALALMSDGLEVCSLLSCCGALVLLPVGFDVCSMSSCCSVLVLLPIGVDDDAGIIVMSCSVSGSTGCFLGELVILLMIFSILLSVFDKLLVLSYVGV